MNKWKKIKVFVVKANGKFINQYHTKEKAEEVAKKYISKGYEVTIKESEVETINVNIGVI